MLEWLKSSNVAEAVRYLKPEQDMDKLELPRLKTKNFYASLICFPLLCNHCSKTMRGKSFDTGKVGGDLPVD